MGNLIATIKNFLIEGDFKSNFELLKVVDNGLNSQIEALVEMWIMEKPPKSDIDITNEIIYFQQLLKDEYEHYERSKTKNLPYWFRTLSVDRIREYEKKINKLNLTLKILKGLKEGFSPEKILAAKEYPIENLIELNKSNFALCPFHKEKTPSFKLFKDNHWKCFGCGEGGDVLDFIMKKNNLDFRQAIDYLINGLAIIG